MASSGTAVLAVAVAAFLGGCGLFTSLGDLSGGEPDPEAASAVDAGADGALDASPLPTGTTDAAEPATTYAAEILADKPIGYWRLDESAGPIAKDSGSVSRRSAPATCRRSASRGRSRSRSRRGRGRQATPAP